MARHKDVDWNLPDGTPTPRGVTEHAWPEVYAALLMDIRDELRRITAALYCPNALNIPRHLKLIATNTTKRKRTKPR